MRWIKVGISVLLASFVLCLVLLFKPSLFFSEKAESGSFTLVDEEITDTQKEILAAVNNRIERSELFSPEHEFNLFPNVGGLYANLVSTAFGRGFGNGYHKNIVITSEINWEGNTSTFNNQSWNLTELIAHEAVHSMQFQNLGWKKSNPVAGYPLWKWEGYAEYIGRGKKGPHNLLQNMIGSFPCFLWRCRMKRISTS